MGKPCRKDVESARSGPDFSRILNKLEGAEKLRQSGSHEIWKLPNGELLINTNHPGDMARGTRFALIKALLPYVAILLAAILVAANWL